MSRNTYNVQQCYRQTPSTEQSCLERSPWHYVKLCPLHPIRLLGDKELEKKKNSSTPPPAG